MCKAKINKNSLRWPVISQHKYCLIRLTGQIASTTKGQTAEARKTTILQPLEQKPDSQKDRQDEKAEGYIPDEGTR